MHIEIESDEAMKTFGRQLAGLLKGGSCIELVGDIGSGKTTLTKGIADGMGITDTVQSPTFTINRTYETPNGLHLSHYDFYRLTDPGIMSAELDESLTDESTVIVIEWAEVVQDILPADHLRITFESPTETSRMVTLSAGGPRSQAVIGAIK
jgi:tRNA threonylcarbamoyladenosine biosynthesis protein TsaE